MLHKVLDRLLALHFREHPVDNRLHSLEQDVWRRVRGASAEIVQPWYDKMVMAFAVPQFRMASIAFALVIGIGISSVFRVPANSDVIDMDLFATNSPYLAINLIGYVE